MTEPAREWLIAHRGWPARYPENSLAGIGAALEAGARFVEFDVQISADGRPVVIHDDDLRRLTGRAGRLTDLRAEAIAELRLSRGGGVPTLEQALALFESRPEATAFVELKRQSIARFGRERCVRAVCQRLRRAACGVVFLSFDRGAAALARRFGVESIGWVIRRFSIANRLRARTLRPEYLFIRGDRVLESRPLWTGPWAWAIYGVEDLDAARGWRRRGADLVEVDDLPGLLERDRHGR
jgi:glycerophosphoryl diester phosphodiesterase